MKKMRTSFWVVMVLILQGCAHSSTEKKIDDELKQEKFIQSTSDLRSEIDHLIATAPGLTSEQRSKLSNLKESTNKKIDEVRAQSYQLRSVLIKQVISSKYDKDEVEMIKARLKNLEEKRLTLLFHSVDQVNKILGHLASENEEVIQALVNEHTTR